MPHFDVTSTCYLLVSFIPSQGSPMFAEHHTHKFIFNLHFIDIFMDSNANITGKTRFLLLRNSLLVFHLSSE